MAFESLIENCTLYLDTLNLYFFLLNETYLLLMKSPTSFINFFKTAFVYS